MQNQSVHIALRKPSLNDAAYMLRCENNPEAMHVSGHQGGFTLEDIQAFITAAHNLETQGQARWMIDLDGYGAVGMIDLFDFNPEESTAALGIWLDTEHRKSGFGRQAIQLITEHVKSKLKLKRIFADIQEDNRASIAFFERIGFQHKHTRAQIMTYQLAM